MPSPCCHIPTATTPNWPPTLEPDAKRFAQYVGGVAPDDIELMKPASVLTSALHCEMRLWPISKRMALNLYQKNDSAGNAWRAMQHRVTATQSIFPQFLLTAKCEIFSSIAKMPTPLPRCSLLQFDDWHLSNLVSLRNAGLANAGIQAWIRHGDNKPPELGTVGLAQKLINVFLKYELCWQVAGQCRNGDMEAYQPRRIPQLPQYLCVLHAPIDRILLQQIVKLPLGKWLNGKGFLNNNGSLIQSSGGAARPWSKLDCLRTYYGLQLMLRKIAMHTWPKGCACDNSADDAIRKCANWFNEQYGKTHLCGKNNPDWIEEACKLPEDVVKETVLHLLGGPLTKKRAGAQPASLKPNKTHSSKDKASSLNATKASPPSTKKRITSNSKHPHSNEDCRQCRLGKAIIREHRARLLAHDNNLLPACDEDVVVQHDNHHRIRTSFYAGWAWQYHVNRGSVRVDRFSEGNQLDATIRYDQLRADRGVLGHDFGNGIIGNGTRSIRKSTTRGANADVADFQAIASEAVNIMAQIYQLFPTDAD
jgi:hypothetical protein